MKATEKFFDNWKTNLQAKSTTELHKAIAELSCKYRWPLHESDPLGIFDLENDKYFCLGDPCTPLSEQLACPTTEFQLIPRR